nr:MAG TPA: hypothetical protein [Bacteriophage sp.]
MIQGAQTQGMLFSHLKIYLSCFHKYLKIWNLLAE